jgi:putative addiction module component (TIGR02574 family)
LPDAFKLDSESDTLTTMSIEAQAVLREALTLPPRERAEVAAELLASLDEPSAGGAEAVQAAWAQELEHRARRALSDEDAGEPWEAVRDRVRYNLAR